MASKKDRIYCGMHRQVEQVKMSKGYQIPKGTHRTEIMVSNSRFVVTVGLAPTVEEARAFIQVVREEMPTANHHVYGFRVGFGGSVIEGMSDDGEPSGTSGPPTLAVLRGSDIGDIVLVTTRFFGGTKLGTGGLVRAYTDAAKEGLAQLATELKVDKSTLHLKLPYPIYQQVARLLQQYDAEIVDEQFQADVEIRFIVLADQVEALTNAIIELSSGTVHPTLLDD